MSRQRILVVDDEDEILEILEEFLEAQGYEVVSTGTGRQALALARQEDQTFDAALVDWTIPGIEGRDVILQLHEDLPQCILFAITGHNVETIRGSSAGHILAGVLRKPFSLVDLAKKLDQALSLSRVH